MKNKNLCPLEKIKEIISEIEQKNIISYEGSIGTSSSVESSPYQIVEIRIAYINDGEQDEERKNG